MGMALHKYLVNLMLRRDSKCQPKGKPFEAIIFGHGPLHAAVLAFH